MPDGYSLSVTVVGAQELAAALKSIDSFAKRAHMDAINKTAHDLLAKAVVNAPHKTGTLWRSIHVESDPGHLAQVAGDNIEAVVGTNLNYAHAQEAGTQGMTIHSKSKTGKAFSYIGNIKPKWYMKKAKDAMKTELTENLSQATQRIVSHLADAGSSAV